MIFNGGRAADRLRMAAAILVTLAGFELIVRPLDLGVQDNVKASLVFFLSVWLTARPTRQARFLPVARTLLPGAGPLLACAALASFSEISVGDVAVPAALVVSLVNMLLMASLSQDQWFSRGRRPLRLAVVGSSHTATALEMELRSLRGADRYQVVGYIHPHEDPDDTHKIVPYLGRQSTLATIVAVNEVDLLLVSAEVPRLSLFEEIARTCLNLPVRVVELAVFYEETFGHVALAAINASWFQYLMHPRYSRATPGVKRAFDLVIAVPALLLAAPIIAVLAALVRVDGGPAFYRQTRIGEGGRPFVIVKLRSMRGESSNGSHWSSRRDERVTRIGAFMRRTHLDELPQVINVIKGEMSIVGPRPEQPAIVHTLESAIPFYSRRHLVRPGITGWAQVQCGYAGSQHGSALKACYDLYYVKHRSVRLDCLIVLETVRSLFADRQWPELSTHRVFAFAAEIDGSEAGSPDLPVGAAQEVEAITPASRSAYPLGA